MQQLPLPLPPLPEAGFAGLVAGPNQQALQYLADLVPGCSGAPVYLWGAGGTGKTRLLRALDQHQRQLGATTAWFEAGTPAPWRLPDGCRLVLVDGCESLDRMRQHAAFALFIDAGSQGAQWAAAGRLPPVDLPLRDDLRTRLGWGHVFALQPLADDETALALRAEAARRGMVLADEVLAYLLTRCERSLHQLVPLIEQLDHLQLAEQRRITVPLVRRLLAEAGTAAATAPAIPTVPTTPAA